MLDDTRPQIFSAPPERRGTWIVLIVVVSLACGTLGYYLYLRPIEHQKTSNAAAISTAQVTENVPVSTPGSQPPLAAQPVIEPAPPVPTAADITTSLLVWFPLTSDFRDQSGNRIRAYPVGDTHIQNGAAVLDGNGDWIMLPFIDLSSKPFSICLSIRLTEQRNAFGLIEQFDAMQNNRFLHFCTRDRAIPYWGFYNNDMQAVDRLTVEDGWIHLAFVFTGKDQQIWSQGHLLAERQAKPYAGKRGDTILGKNPGFSNVEGNDFKGLMRDLRIYDRALTEREIRILAGQPAERPAAKSKELDF